MSRYENMSDEARKAYNEYQRNYKRSRELTPAAKEARNAYQRKWAKENPDKINEYRRRHWEKVAEMQATEPVEN